MYGYRDKSGTVHLHKEVADSQPLLVPCSKCLGCRTSNRAAWALRNHLELKNHDRACWTTLTFDEARCPPTLDPAHLTWFAHRLRKRAKRRATTPLRIFASGEYGEQRGRPHYHAIIYGLDKADEDLIDDAWDHSGITLTTEVTPQNIAYTAGYTAKKLGDHYADGIDITYIDPQTGEWFERTNPFLQMSRRPGIGHNAKQWPQSWRLYAINNGYKMPVPRFLHEAWKAQATKEEIEELEWEKQKMIKPILTEQLLLTQEAIAIDKQRLQARKRHLE